MFSPSLPKKKGNYMMKEREEGKEGGRENGNKERKGGKKEINLSL